MIPIDHGGTALEQWRPGVRTRMRVSALNGATALCVFEQFIDPGCGAPTHRHTVEEVLSVLAGAATVWVGPARAILTAGQSVVVPAGVAHGFENTGGVALHVQAILAAASFEAEFEGEPAPRRRWVRD